ncbi:MAG: yhaH [Rhizobium sp.]|nr:yhaH [Rhizobium sp.]
MNFADAVKSVLTLNYANFNGRASRSEYWWWILFVIIVSIVLSVVDSMIGMQILGPIFSLATLIPGIAVAIRRLHDIGRSGWWFLIVFTIIGAFVLIYWFIQPSEPDNQYGPTPVA